MLWFVAPTLRDNGSLRDRLVALVVAQAELIAEALGKLSTLSDFDYRECAYAAVDGFLATHAKSTCRNHLSE